MLLLMIFALAACLAADGIRGGSAILSDSTAAAYITLRGNQRLLAHLWLLTWYLPTEGSSSTIIRTKPSAWEVRVSCKCLLATELSSVAVNVAVLSWTVLGTISKLAP